MTTATPETTAAADPKADAAAKKAEKAAAKKAEKEAAAKAKADAKEAEKAKKEAEKKAAAEAQKQPEQNDVRRPKPDTLCGKAWAAYDAISAKNGAPATIKEAIAALKGTVDAEATVRTQYARWRKFHGISGRVAAPAPAPTPPAA
jgi:hypothetical protein